MGVIIVYAPTRFEMSDAGRWVRARVIAVMLWAVFVVVGTSSAVNLTDARRTGPGVLQLFLLLTCVVLVVLSTVQFMSVLSLRSQKHAVDMDFLMAQSKGFSIAALLAGFGAILVVDE